MIGSGRIVKENKPFSGVDILVPKRYLSLPALSFVAIDVLIVLLSIADLISVLYICIVPALNRSTEISTRNESWSAPASKRRSLTSIESYTSLGIRNLSSGGVSVFKRP